MKKIISLLTSAVMTISLFMSASFHVIASIYEKTIMTLYLITL